MPPDRPLFGNAAENVGCFLDAAGFVTRLETILSLSQSRRWTPGRKRAMICSSYKPAP
jgi:hypothetical protein